MALPHFVFFEESWNHNNEPPTNEDYLEDGIDDYVSTPKKSGAIED